VNAFSWPLTDRSSIHGDLYLIAISISDGDICFLDMAIY